MKWSHFRLLSPGDVLPRLPRRSFKWPYNAGLYVETDTQAYFKWLLKKGISDIAFLVLCLGHYNYLHLEGYVCFPVSVCWLFCWFISRITQNWMDFQETWIEDGSGPRINPINFWCGSRQMDGSRNTGIGFRWLKFKYVLSDIASGLTELKGAVGPL